jgi:hypothetical protein
VARIVSEDQDERGPETCSNARQSEDKSEKDAGRNKVAECFCLEESRECIALHGLEDVVFALVKNLRVVTAFFFNGSNDGSKHVVRKNDFAFRAW